MKAPALVGGAVPGGAVVSVTARQGLQGRVVKRRRGLTRADAQAAELPDLLKRDFDRHPTAELTEAAINMAAAVRGGDITGVIFHTGKGSQCTSSTFQEACQRLGVVQSTGRAG